MKDWRRKLRNLFRNKRDTNEAQDENSSNMMEKRAERKSTHQRLLPHVPHIVTTHTSFETIYRNIGGRISENFKETKDVEKPTEHNSELSKETPLSHNKNTKTCGNGPYSKTEIGDDLAKADKHQTMKMDLEADKLFVPEILISHAENDEHIFESDTPKQVFICGHVDNSLWHPLLVDLCKEFSVRCSSYMENQACDRWIQRADVFVFLMDEESVQTSVYKDQLRLAIMLDLNIVYVRDLGFELKKREEWGIFSHKHLKSENKGLERNNLLHPTMSNDIAIRQPIESTVVDIEHDDGPASLLGVHQRGSVSFGNGLESSGRRRLDIDRILEREYGTALVYHNLYHKKCLDRIVFSISSFRLNIASGTSSRAYSHHSLNSESVLFSHSRHSLNTPAFSMSSSVSNDSALGDMYRRMTPEPVHDHLQTERSRSLDESSFPSALSSPIETVYLLSQNVGTDKPEVFHWPADLQKDITSSPSIDSFGFQDIDLSKRVNEIDLFEEYLSD